MWEPLQHRDKAVDRATHAQSASMKSLRHSCAGNATVRAARPRLVMVRAATSAKGFGSVKQSVPSCPCGSKLVYRECCEPLHTGRVLPSTGETTLRSRFSAFSKGQVEYLTVTDQRASVPEDQRKRDAQYACNSLSCSNLKILQTEAVEADPAGDSQRIKFQYKSQQQVRGRKPSNNKSVNLKAEQPERLIDGSLKVTTTVERSKFQKCASGAWVLVETEVISKA